MIVQFAGLLITIYSTSALQFYVQSSSAGINSFEAAVFYAVYIIVVAAALILFFKFYSGRLLFPAMEALVVMLATGFVIFAILSAAFPQASQYYILGIAAIVTIALIIAKNLRPKLRNLIAVTSSIGVGILIGLNGFYLAYFLMMLIAVYDYIAVFVTKHMISMAQAISARNMAFLIGSTDVEAIPGAYLSKRDILDYKKADQSKHAKDPQLRSLIRQRIYPIVSQVQLGSGDLAMPLMLAVSIYISLLSIFDAVLVIIGAICGMVFTMYLLKRYRVALPAIPPLFAFINISLAIVFAISDFQAYHIWLGFLAVSAITLLVLYNKLRKGEPAPRRGARGSPKSLYSLKNKTHTSG